MASLIHGNGLLVIINGILASDKNVVHVHVFSVCIVLFLITRKTDLAGMLPSALYVFFKTWAHTHTHKSCTQQL